MIKVKSPARGGGPPRLPANGQSGQRTRWDRALGRRRRGTCLSSLVPTFTLSSSPTLLLRDVAGREEGQPQASRPAVLHLPQTRHGRIDPSRLLEQLPPYKNSPLSEHYSGHPQIHDSCITRTSSATSTLIPVSDSTSSALNPAATSSSTKRPPLVFPVGANQDGRRSSARSVTIASTTPRAVSGKSQFSTSLGAPRASVCSSIAITCRAPTARSIAPPMPPPTMPGTDQLARSPLPPTWYVPSTTAYSRPPRAISNEVTL